MWPILEQTATDGLKTELENAWLDANFMHMSQDAPQRTTTMCSEADASKFDCHSLGLCCCHGDRRNSDAVHFHRKIVALYRPFFLPKRQPRQQGPMMPVQPKKKGQKPLCRQLLERAFLVLSLYPSKSDDELKQDRDTAELAADRLRLRDIGWGETALLQADKQPRAVDLRHPAVDRNALDPLHFHMGFVNFSSYNFTVLPLQHTETKDDPDVGKRLLVLSVPEQCSILRSIHCFRDTVDFDAKWTAKWRVIFSDDSCLPDWDTVANKIEVEDPALLPELVVWKAGPESKGGRGREGVWRARGKEEGEEGGGAERGGRTGSMGQGARGGRGGGASSPARGGQSTCGCSLDHGVR